MSESFARDERASANPVSVADPGNGVPRSHADSSAMDNARVTGWRIEISRLRSGVAGDNERNQAAHYRTESTLTRSRLEDCLEQGTFQIQSGGAGNPTPPPLTACCL
jgi:hypothetical protein